MVCYDRCWVRRDVGVGAMCSSSARVLSCLYGVKIGPGLCGVATRLGRRCVGAVSAHTVLPFGAAFTMGVANGSLNPPTRGQGRRSAASRGPLRLRVRRACTDSFTREQGHLDTLATVSVRPHPLQSAPCLMKGLVPRDHVAGTGNTRTPFFSELLS